MANNNLETTEKESKQYIVVMVGSEQYGIDISYIDNNSILLTAHHNNDILFGGQ